MLLMPQQERRAYLSRLQPYVTASLALFAAGMMIGLIIVYRVPALTDRFTDTLAEFIGMFTGMPRWKLAAAIFLNNALKTLLAILLGPALGIVPAIFLLANGAALGVALSLSIKARGWATSLLSIVPHGLLELPAVFLGTSIGVMLGIHTVKRFAGKSETNFRAEMGRALKYYCTVILPLLFVAALVEAFLTAALVAPR
jgi:stage II sporulation protein M